MAVSAPNVVPGFAAYNELYWVHASVRRPIILTPVIACTSSVFGAAAAFVVVTFAVDTASAAAAVTSMQLSPS